MRSFNDIVYGILNEENENDGQSIPDPGVFGPPKRNRAVDRRDDYLASGMLPVVSDEPSIGNMIYSLIKSLDEDTKTNTGAVVADVLEDILDELEDIVMASRRSSNPSHIEIEKLIRRL